MSDKTTIETIKTQKTEKEQTMKTGEFYRSIYNHYVSKVTKVGRHEVILENKQGVADKIDIENFDTNWRRCITIYEYRDTIADAFKHVNYQMLLIGECVKVTVDEDFVMFSIANNMLRIQVSDDVRDALDLKYNVADFLMEDVLDVIYTIGSLFE